MPALLPMLLAFATVSAPPALPIGRVQWAGRATGFMVGPCTMITAKHAGPRGRARAGAKVRVWIGGERTKGTVVAVGDNDDVWARGRLRRGDWALLDLDRCVGQRLGYFRLLPGSFVSTPQFRQQGAPARAVGFPFGRASAASSHCPATSVQRDGTIEMRCELLAGQSGGPIYVRAANGGLLALGIISAGERGFPLSYAAELETAAALLARPPSDASGGVN